MHSSADTDMNELDVKKQAKLSFHRVFALTGTGIKYRLFRSVVTMVVITVAVTFMMNILGEGVVKSSVSEATGEALREKRIAISLASRITTVGNADDVLVGIISSRVDEPLYKEYRRMGSLSESEMSFLKEFADSIAPYMAFFDGLDFARRAVMLEGALGKEVFEYLSNPENFAGFSERMSDFSQLRLPGSREQLLSLLGDWSRASEYVERILQGRRDAVAQVTDYLEGGSALEALQNADGEFGEVLRTAGFSVSSETAKKAARLAREYDEIQALAESFRNSLIRKRLIDRYNLRDGKIVDTLIWTNLAQPRHAEWFAGQLVNAGISRFGGDGERVLYLAQSMVENRYLDVASKITAEVGGGLMGMGTRMTWLVVLSMLVCGVGIANAMLMSVAERFREIATMKCLGALDGTIMMIFILEAAFIGTIGGVLGGVLGSVLSTTRMAMVFGVQMFGVLDYGSWVIALILSALAGMVLSAMAALYPSWMASRLPPMEAMRIE